VNYFLKSRNSAEIDLFNTKISFIDKQMNRVMLSKGQRFIQEKVMASILANQYEQKQFKGFSSLIKQARHDLYMATFQNTHSFFWRNFSKYVRCDHSRRKSQDPTGQPSVSDSS
jgi:hypothetical protein